MAPRVRLMTYNMHSGVGLDNKYDLQRIARVVGAAAPDILCMQVSMHTYYLRVQAGERDEQRRVKKKRYVRARSCICVCTRF